MPGSSASGRRNVRCVLGGGITNHNLKVEVDGDSSSFASQARTRTCFGIDRSVELAATERAATLGVGPRSSPS
jgi:hypothetical protein